MPETGVYFVSPRLIASMAAFLILSGVSKSGSPAPRPITSRPFGFQLARFLGNGDGGGRLHTGKSVGKKGHDMIDCPSLQPIRSTRVSTA
jgi:hypothetical protein